MNSIIDKLEKIQADIQCIFTVYIYIGSDC